MKIRQCQEAHIPEVAALFNQYRIFYGKTDDQPACEKFITENIVNSRSEIFLAFSEDENLIGFAQLYPSFCSVEMQPIRYLYDLFIAERHRGQGYSKLLMQHILENYRGTSVKRITLDTAFTNKIAQSLYESVGLSAKKILFFIIIGIEVGHVVEALRIFLNFVSFAGSEKIEGSR